jgi:hypothetical protein
LFSPPYCIPLMRTLFIVKSPPGLIIQKTSHWLFISFLLMPKVTHQFLTHATITFADSSDLEVDMYYGAGRHSSFSLPQTNWALLWKGSRPVLKAIEEQR